MDRRSRRCATCSSGLGPRASGPPSSWGSSAPVPRPARRLPSSSGPPPREPAQGGCHGIWRRPAVIAVAIWAVDATAQDGITSLIEHAPGVELVGIAEDEFALVRLLEAVRVDVVVVALGSDTARDFVAELAEEAAVIALVREGADAMAALRAGARAVLLRPADRAELAAAIQAVAAGRSGAPSALPGRKG